MDLINNVRDGIIIIIHHHLWSSNQSNNNVHNGIIITIYHIILCHHCCHWDLVTAWRDGHTPTGIHDSLVNSVLVSQLWI